MDKCTDEFCLSRDQQKRDEVQARIVGTPVDLGVLPDDYPDRDYIIENAKIVVARGFKDPRWNVPGEGSYKIPIE